MYSTIRYVQCAMTTENTILCTLKSYDNGDITANYDLPDR